MSFAAITLYVVSQWVFFVVSIYFVIDSVPKLLDTSSYVYNTELRAAVAQLVWWLGFGLGDRDSIPGRGWDLFCSPSHPERLWGPGSLLPNGCLWFFLRVCGERRVKLTAHLHLLPGFGNEWSCTSTPPVCLHGVVPIWAQGHFHLHRIIVYVPSLNFLLVICILEAKREFLHGRHVVVLHCTKAQTLHIFRSIDVHNFRTQHEVTLVWIPPYKFVSPPYCCYWL
jgi:hypothetical protein